MELKRESILVSVVRAFCRAFAGVFGIIVGLLIIGFVVVFLAKPRMESDKTALIIGTDAEGNRKHLSLSSPAILRINIHGVIGGSDLNSKTIESQLLDSREGALKDSRVKAIFLHINSPGGTAFDSHDIYTKLIRYKAKYDLPIYAYVDGMCASGGMMIACAAEKIFSAPVGIIGSVGVIMGPNFNVAALMERFGIKQVTLSKGKDKDMLSPFREWKPGEDQSLKDIVEYDYNLFVDLVSNARPRLSRTKLVDDYGAQVFNPVTAAEYGYIDDGNSSYNAALTQLVAKAGLKKDEKYQVVELKVLHPVLSGLIEGKSPLSTGKIRHELVIGPDFHPELMNRPLYLYSPALQLFESY